MNTTRAISLLAPWLLLLSPLAHAAPALEGSATPTRQDCQEILAQAAKDPKAVPKRLADTCRQLIAAPNIAPAAGSNPEDNRNRPLTAGVDPCSGPNAGSSVLCWGPWAALAPSALGPDNRVQIADVRDPEQRPELAGPYDPQVEPPPTPEPELPLGPCAPGTSCGFATIVDGTSSKDSPENTDIGRIQVNPDGTSFVVDPPEGDDINSVPNMNTNYQPRPNDDFENLRATGRVDDEQSQIIGRVIRDENGEIQLAADIWGHGNGVTREAQSGFFAWGVTTSQAGLNTLNAGNTTVNFVGPMSVNNATQATMTVNFGTTPTWTGTWTNPAWSFGAGGPVSGVNMISADNQFTSNVTGTGNYVQGAVVGEPGNQGVVHAINVNLQGPGLIKDVGLLRQSIPVPAQP